MQRLIAIDSIVLQALGDDDFRIAKEISDAVGGVLELIKCPPLRPTKMQRKMWRDITGRLLPKTSSFIALIHHSRGQSIPLIRYGMSRGLEVHFHGLQQYDSVQAKLNDGAVQRKAIFEELMEKWDKEMRLIRFDRCVDSIGVPWKEYSNSRIHRALCKKHGASVFAGTTIYYQPPKPKYVKVTAYDKQCSNTLEYPLTRVEFSFKGQYWTKFPSASIAELLNTATSKTDGFLRKLFSLNRMGHLPS